MDSSSKISLPGDIEARVAVIRALVEPLFARHPAILFAILYGSMLEKADPRDVDLAVFVDRAQVPRERDLDFAFDLIDLLEPQLDRPLDLWVLNDLPLTLRYRVSRGKPVWIRDEEAYYRFLERTWDEYFDFQPVMRRYLDELARCM